MATEGTCRGIWRVNKKWTMEFRRSTRMKGDGEEAGKVRTDPRMHVFAPSSCSSITAPRSLDLGLSMSIMRPPCHRPNPASGSRIRREDRQMSTPPLPSRPFEEVKCSVSDWVSDPKGNACLDGALNGMVRKGNSEFLYITCRYSAGTVRM